MSQFTLPGEPPVVVNLRRSARARRLSLRVSQLDGRVTLTLPKGAAEREARAFAGEKADWIRGHLARQPAEDLVGIGSVLPVEGQLREVVSTGARRGVQMTDTQLIVSDKSPERRLRAFLTELARERLAEASDTYADRLGKGYQAITLRDTRSRWGSCTSKGRLMYSWRLIMAPPEVLRYVAAHEVAHLQEMNHSQAFWDAVERIHGPYAAPRRWLRDNSGQLHRYRF